jgi:hypothetical protein
MTAHRIEPLSPEQSAAQSCELLAIYLMETAHYLRRVKTKEARQHAKEATGAARIARQWAQELRGKK